MWAYLVQMSGLWVLYHIVDLFCCTWVCLSSTSLSMMLLSFGLQSMGSEWVEMRKRQMQVHQEAASSVLQARYRMGNSPANASNACCFCWCCCCSCSWWVHHTAHTPSTLFVGHTNTDIVCHPHTVSLEEANRDYQVLELDGLCGKGTMALPHWWLLS